MGSKNPKNARKTQPEPKSTDVVSNASDQRDEPTGKASSSATIEDSTAEGHQISTQSPSTFSSGNPNSFHAVNPPLSAGVLQYVASRNFQTMTPVQAATIPLFLTNKDVAVQAVTGSGKTLAFLIPIVEMILRRTVLLKKYQIAALVLSPTRELARQTYSVACELCKFSSIPEPLLLVGGGSSYRPVSEDLRAFQKHGSDVVIGTPGRIEDVLTRYDVMDVSELECLVLDEADVLLDMGFDVTLNSILSKLPRMRRTGLFSATGTGGKGIGGAGSRGIKELMKRAGMRNPVLVNVAIATHAEKDNAKLSSGESQNVSPATTDVAALERAQEQATPSSLSNYYLVSPLDEKLSRLVLFLQTHSEEKVIVFFLTCACVEFFGLALQQLLKGQYVELLHGKMVQKRRENAMERFRGSRSKGGTLLCTDVAARGLDVTDVNWVVQFDAPQDPASFVHRVGRSARAGRVGNSLLFITEKEESYIDLLRNRKVPLVPLPVSEGCVPPQADLNAKPKHMHHKEPTERSDPSISRPIYSAKDNDSTILDVLPLIRSMVLDDRDLLEKGTKAFTSYIRAYKEHHCAFIFR
jgi:ATP-dependent RNA helicase DDX55/SPB4